MKIDWSKVTVKVVVHCDTEEKANALLKANEDRGYQGVKFGNCWDSNKSETCYRFFGVHWSYCDKAWYENKGYTIIPFDDLLIRERSKAAELLNLEIGDSYEIEGYCANPCVVDENYNLVQEWGIKVGAAWIIKMINNPSILHKLDKPSAKEMTISEIEEALGYSVKIVKDGEK